MKWLCRKIFGKKYYIVKTNKLLKDEISWSEMWLKFGQESYNYDKNFTNVSNYAINHNIKELI